MRTYSPLVCCCLWTVGWLLTIGFFRPPSMLAAEPNAASELFETKIRPVLVEVCFKCHGSDKDSGNLRVDSRAALLKGGDTSPAIVPNKPAESLLLKALRHTDDDLKMPPDKRLPDETIAAFESWIAAGAPWPEGKSSGFQAKRHWAFQPIGRPQIPSGRKPMAAVSNLKSQISNFKSEITHRRLHSTEAG